MATLPVLRSVRWRFVWTARQAPGKSKLLTGGDLDLADLEVAVAAAPGVITSVFDHYDRL
ncbi:hypothetical protein OG742_41770 [Streptomyces sp. NBC_00828]|uniref:hypothetical protein n=1 Tax=Streptomyces sp. NBC_00828 TaxID=2903678 RepID=UPI00386A6EAE